MLNNKQLILIASTLLAISQLSVGCSAEDIAVEDSSNKGILCLSLSSGDEFVKVETRAGQTLNGFALTLKKSGQEVEFELNGGQAIIEAGTYTLSATNSVAVRDGYDGALYSGATSFTLSAGEQKEVTLSLGTPKNAMISLSLSQEFSAKYDLYSMTLTDGTKSSTLTTSNTTAYFPAIATTLSYTLVANAKAGSHVQDITSATGTITIAAGTHTPVTLNLNPIDPNLIVIETGTTHSGEFE